ncbi:hypothetical protein COOONC_22655 [Cooperia oncophora]
MVLAEGYHRLPMLLMLPTNLPGSFDGKYGAIAYRIVVKVRKFDFLFSTIFTTYLRMHTYRIPSMERRGMKK